MINQIDIEELIEELGSTVPILDKQIRLNRQYHNTVVPTLIVILEWIKKHEKEHRGKK